MTHTEYFKTLDAKGAELDKLEKAYKDAVKVTKSNKGDLKAEIAETKAKLNYLIALDDYYEFAQLIDEIA